MSDLTIYPKKLKGEVTPPPSKSIAHRAIILAAISQGDCLINNVRLSDDIEATIDGMKAMGSKFELIEDKLFVRRCVRNVEADINCRESGSTMRFLIPLAAALGITARFTGQGRLPERPLKEYDEILSGKGIIVKSRGGYLPMEVKGKLQGGLFRVSGNVTSQFVSGLLMALPMTGEGGEIELTTELQSEPYVNMTVDVMEKFGVPVKRTEKGFSVDSEARYKSTDFMLEGDYSQAAFYLVANELGSDIKINGLSENSLQGDKEITNIIEIMRAEGEMTLNAKDIPDLVPVLTVLAGLRRGKTVIRNAERLKYKESDRLRSTYEMIKALGGNIEMTEDGFVVFGVDEYTGGVVDSFNDHRIAMSAAVAATRANRPVKIKNCGCVKKSYGSFFEDYVKLHGRVRG